jgi:hypothetical protein
LLAGIHQAPLGRDHRVFQLGVAFLLGGGHQVQLFEARLAGHAALFELRIHLGEFGVQLVTAPGHLLGLLRQAQDFDLKLMRPRLAVGAVAAGAGQPLRRVGAGGFGRGAWCRAWRW